MQVLLGVGDVALEQPELAPPERQPRGAVDDADVAGVGADDGALAALHHPRLDAAHVGGGGGGLALGGVLSYSSSSSSS